MRLSAILHRLTHDGWLIVHVLVTGVPMWFAAVLALPHETFAGSPTFSGMAALAPEWQWAVASAAVAVIGGTGPWVPSVLWWRASCSLLAAWHGTLALCVFIASPFIPGTGTYILLAAAATLKILRPLRAHRARR